MAHCGLRVDVLGRQVDLQAVQVRVVLLVHQRQRREVVCDREPASRRQWRLTQTRLLSAKPAFHQCMTVHSSIIWTAHWLEHNHTFYNHVGNEGSGLCQAGRHSSPHPHGFGGMAVVIATLGCPGGRGRRTRSTPSSAPLLKRDSRSAQPLPAARRARRNTVGCGVVAAVLCLLNSVRRCRLAGRVDLSEAGSLSSAAPAPAASSLPSAGSAAASSGSPVGAVPLLLSRPESSTPSADSVALRPASSSRISTSAPQVQANQLIVCWKGGSFEHSRPKHTDTHTQMHGIGRSTVAGCTPA